MQLPFHPVYSAFLQTDPFLRLFLREEDQVLSAQRTSVRRRQEITHPSTLRQRQTLFLGATHFFRRGWASDITTNSYSGKVARKVNVLNTSFNCTCVFPRMQKCILRGPNFKNRPGGARSPTHPKDMPPARVVPSPPTPILIENPGCQPAQQTFLCELQVDKWSIFRAGKTPKTPFFALCSTETLATQATWLLKKSCERSQGKNSQQVLPNYHYFCF